MKEFKLRPIDIGSPYDELMDAVIKHLIKFSKAPEDLRDVCVHSSAVRLLVEIDETLKANGIGFYYK